jgi:uncharacterized protein (TIGR04551 family)
MSSRLPVAVSVLLFTAGPALAADPAPAAKGAAAAPAEKPSSELDPRVRELVEREVAKAKAELQDLTRAEAQSEQARNSFMGPLPEEKPRLQFFQVKGYYRLRGDLFDHLDLNRNADPSGYYLFPRPLVDTLNHGTITTGNMRLRLEPTLNVSEDIRIHTQIDVLDNLVLGSTPEGLFQNVNQVAPIPFLSAGQVPPESGVNSDRASIRVKQAYAEVRTLLGLLTFGRQPSEWGLGILSNAGNGTNDDFGDTVDRIKFALTLPDTPVGRLTLVPMIDWMASGAVAIDPRATGGIGQPFDRDQADDAKAVGIQISHVDTPERRSQRLEAGLSNFNYGVWYSYRSQSYDLPGYDSGSVNSGTVPSSSTNGYGSAIKRGAYAHVFDLWSRYETKRFSVEAELAAIYGQIGNASLVASDTLGPVLLRQFGGVVRSEYKAVPGKLTLTGELGFASGDRDPGFGNQPGRGCSTTNTSIQQSGYCAWPKYGDVEGPQFQPGDKVLDIRNFSFNRAYRVDLILWRELLGSVTDAWYVKPSLRWDIFDGLSATVSGIYSQAIYGESTPSSTGPGTGNKPLGIELDGGLRYGTDDGFSAFIDYGLLFPLGGFDDNRTFPQPASSSKANALRAGLVVKF